MTPNEITRRGWFLRLGGAAAFSQFSAFDAAAAPPEKLPPGLYAPSIQHLAHSLKAAAAPLPELLSPRHFGAEDSSLLKKIVALILGEDASMPTILEIAAWIDIEPTAVFCYDDLTALGALAAARSAGVSVPADLSVVGFDDLFVSSYTAPPLTTLRQPMNEMGQRAAEILLALLRGEAAERKVKFQGVLVVRESTAPARNSRCQLS